MNSINRTLFIFSFIIVACTPEEVGNLYLPEHGNGNGNGDPATSDGDPATRTQIWQADLADYLGIGVCG